MSYETKFKEFIRMCSEMREDDVVLISHPQVLGDTYDEVIKSLGRLASAKLALRIVNAAPQTSATKVN